MADIISTISDISMGVVTKAGYLFNTQTVDLNTYVKDGVGHLTKRGLVFLSSDSLTASGQRWPSGV